MKIRFVALTAFAFLTVFQSHLEASLSSSETDQPSSPRKGLVSSTEDAENGDPNTPLRVRPKAQKSKVSRKRERTEQPLQQSPSSQKVEDLDAELEHILDHFRRAPLATVAGHPADEIISPEFAEYIRQRLNIQGPLPACYKDIRLLEQEGIRFVILDTEWDRDRNITEVSAIEFINGKRQRILFKKYNTEAPASHDMKAILDFIKDDPNSGLVTITVAHNAPADFGMLLHELHKHFRVAHTGGRPRILEHDTLNTHWFDTYRFLQRKWQIESGNHYEQVKIKPVNFSFASANEKHAKAIAAKLKREKAKARKKAKIREEELHAIEAGLMNPDGNLIINAPKKPTTKKPSFKLGDSFARTGLSMPTLQQRLRIPAHLPQEKGIIQDDFGAHNALYDICMTYGVVKTAYTAQRDEYPDDIARKLTFESPKK